MLAPSSVWALLAPYFDVRHDNVRTNNRFFTRIRPRAWGADGSGSVDEHEITNAFISVGMKTGEVQACVHDIIRAGNRGIVTLEASEGGAVLHGRVRADRPARLQEFMRGMRTYIRNLCEAQEDGATGERVEELFLINMQRREAFGTRTPAALLLCSMPYGWLPNPMDSRDSGPLPSS